MPAALWRSLGPSFPISVPTQVAAACLVQRQNSRRMVCCPRKSSPLAGGGVVVQPGLGPKPRVTPNHTLFLWSHDKHIGASLLRSDDPLDLLGTCQGPPGGVCASQAPLASFTAALPQPHWECSARSAWSLSWPFLSPQKNWGSGSVHHQPLEAFLVSNSFGFFQAGSLPPRGSAYSSAVSAHGSWGYHLWHRGRAQPGLRPRDSRE